MWVLVFFCKIAALLGTGQALSDACSPCFSTQIVSQSGCYLSIYILCNPEWIPLSEDVYTNLPAFMTSFGKVFPRPAR